VRRVVRCLPGRQVAAGVSAVGRRNRQRIVVVDVTLCAGRDFAHWGHLVRIRQREAGGGVIKRRVGPACRVVAGRALRCGEARLDVIGDVAAKCLCAVPVRGVATVAIRRGQSVVVIDVARDAGSGQVRSRQRPTGGSVVKGHYVGPGNCVVTGRAVGSRKGSAGR